MHKWFVIAKNEYRLRTSSIRKVRPYFPYIAIAITAMFVGVVAPALVNPIIGILDIEGFLTSGAEMAIMVIILFMFFFYFIMFPISTTLKDIDTQEYDIFLSAPVDPGDVLLGKFLGATPLYSIAIAIITGFFAAFLIPLGIDLLQIAIIVAVFILTFLSATWIGTLIAGLLRTRLGRTARGKDIGKAIPLIIGLPMIAVMYALMGGGLFEALLDPGASGAVETVMMIFPSSWGGKLFVLFAQNPGDTAAIWLETLTLFGGLIIFFIGSLWVGLRLARRAYSFETTTFSAATAKPDGAFYRTVRAIGGGGSFGALLVSITKDYGRRFENLSKIMYVVGLLVLVSIFFADYEDAVDAMTMGIFILPLLAAFVVGEVTIRGKDSLFIYRKAPIGEARFILARLMQGWIMVLPVVATYGILTQLRVQGNPPLSLVAYTAILLLYAAGIVVYSLGIFMMMPVFSDKPVEMMGNVMIVMFSSMMLFIFSVELSGSMSAGLLIMVVLMWMLGAIALYRGKKKLSSIE